MKKSIMQTDKRCYECGAITGLELHHCLHGVANRKLADRDGLVCWLCRYHHYMVHFGTEGYRLDLKLKKDAQIAWMHKNKKTEEDFRKRYGKDYTEL